jgi:succinate dehydrogenase/fumarate reductase flavoprotein subunit
MWKRCGVERESVDLRQGLEEIKQIERDLLPRMSIGSGKSGPVESYPQELMEAWELMRMATLAGQVISSAIARKETRGHHLRADYPETEREARHIFLSREKGLRMGKVKRMTR